MGVSERILTTVNRRKMAFIGCVLMGKDINSNLLPGMAYGMRGEDEN